MNLNFKISELIYSDIATQNNINNMPDINALDKVEYFKIKGREKRAFSRIAKRLQGKSVPLPNLKKI